VEKSVRAFWEYALFEWPFSAVVVENILVLDAVTLAVMTSRAEAAYSVEVIAEALLALVFEVIYTPAAAY